MKTIWGRATVVALVGLLAGLSLFGDLSASTCTDGVKIPAFLASGVEPNLLLILDNSASMNDLAYIGSQGTCYDDTYSAADTYAGYFDTNTWYQYGSGKFAATTAASGCSGYSYKAEGEVCVQVTASSKRVDKFAARGNFLNWAAASKIDIEKKILTGGKYDSGNLVLESRGCLGRRYVKKTAVKNSSNATSYLTLGIRPPETAEKNGDSADDTTRIEIFQVTATGFNNTPCQSAITELQQPSPNQGTLKSRTEDCMGYTNGNNAVADKMNAFNHSLQNCWYLAKHGSWESGNGSVRSAENDCEKVYAGIAPNQIEPDDRAYVCTSKATAEHSIGYVGRCWDVNKWGTGGYKDTDTCVDAALKDYCQDVRVPEVLDPSDQVGISGDFWNIPAVLVDSGVVAQMADPWLIMTGKIAVTSAPSGIIQETAGDIRMGAMIFNDDGSRSECSQPNPYVLYKCASAGNKDGGRIISEIGKDTSSSPTHTAQLVAAINGTKATSWTPLAEAMYNAIGYFGQNTSRRLDTNDWPTTDPICAWCQSNNVLLITDGGSTADMNSTVYSFATGKNPDTDPSGGCGQLNGSTLLNDLTYYAKTGADIYSSEPWRETVGGVTTKSKQTITTHIVVSGDVRTGGTGDCGPSALLSSSATNGGTTLYSATNPSELEAKIRQAFAAIRSGAASGSAASVISSSRGGEGALYQATFWPNVDGLNGSKIAWTGEVHAMFVNDDSEMLEDTDADGRMESTDSRVVIYYDASVRDSRACYGTVLNGACTGTSRNIKDVKYLWSASGWLNSIADGDILANRSTYLSSERKRYVFTWNDLNNNGVVDTGEILPFVDTSGGSPVNWAGMSVATGRGTVALDFGLPNNDRIREVIRWIRGLDQTGMRSRQVAVDTNGDGVYDSTRTWRLGDVIHSTPVPVSRPSEAYHTVYRDTTYAGFVDHYKNRRHVIYFGGNDGMVHAVNGGFYDSTYKRFCRSSGCTNESTGPELGAELWAYVPYNLTPHLKCLTAVDYTHKYYVDLQPRVFDVQIFDNDSTHPGGWGTIMVIGMGFGGAKVEASKIDADGNGTFDTPGDSRVFTSSYMIFDITNPESPPVLLGEFTRKGDATSNHVNLGYTTSVPALVPMKSGSNTDWYLVMGSGPTMIEGESEQEARIAVLPLKTLTASTRGAFQITDSAPTTGDRGAFRVGGDKSFVGDIVSVDFELTPEFKADAVYFGTVSGSFSPSPAWSGKLYRLVTRHKELVGTQLTRVATAPHSWSAPSLLFDAGQPITAAPAIGWDGRNYWVYAGTGRFLHESEKSDTSQQSFYGIKEPLDNKEFTWATVNRIGSHNSTPGMQGLQQVDQILVHQSGAAADAVLSCKDGGTTCLPLDETGTRLSRFSQLVTYIVGTGQSAAGKDGWYINFDSSARERNLGQGVLLGGLLTFTTYMPYNDLCLSEGLSDLYGVYYQTGTSWYKPVFGTGGIDGDSNVVSMLPLGHGLSKQPNLHVGNREGTTVFLQSSTGAILEIQQPLLPLGNTKTGKVSWRGDVK